METAEQKASREQKEALVEKVDAVIKERKAGGPDAIGEIEQARLLREAAGRATRGEPQDLPVAMEPLEPSVSRLVSHKSDLESAAEGADLAVAKARQEEEAVAGASLSFLDDSAPKSAPASEADPVVGSKKAGKGKK